MATLDLDSWAVENWQTMVSCERCGMAVVSVRTRKAATAYLEPEKNKPLLLCDPCAEEYYAYWESQWADYNAGRL